MTASKDGATRYAIYALDDEEKVPAEIAWEGQLPAGGKVTLLNTGKVLKAVQKGSRVVVALPKNLPEEPIALSYNL